MAEPLGRAALAELRRLLPTPCPVCGGRRWFAELSSGFGCYSVPVPAVDDSAGQDAAARYWLASYEPSAPGAVSKLLDAAIDPALLRQLAARYKPQSDPVCGRCGVAMVRQWIEQDGTSIWGCPNPGHPHIVQEPGREDEDVLCLLAAIRGETVPDAS